MFSNRSTKGSYRGDAKAGKSSWMHAEDVDGAIMSAFVPLGKPRIMLVMVRYMPEPQLPIGGWSFCVMLGPVTLAAS